MQAQSWGLKEFSDASASPGHPQTRKGVLHRSGTQTRQWVLSNPVRKLYSPLLFITRMDAQQWLLPLPWTQTLLPCSLGPDAAPHSDMAGGSDDGDRHGYMWEACSVSTCPFLILMASFEL